MGIAVSQEFVAPPRLPEHKRLHIASLDGVRGLAIVLVLVFHSTVEYQTGRPLHFIEKLYTVALSVGWCGVNLFFVLSGFLITGVLLDSRGNGRYFQNFYMRRVLRIFPLYYGTLLVFFLLLGPLLRGATCDPQFPWLAAHQGWFWAYVQNWLFAFGQWPSTMLGHFWSLAIEEQFYVVWPLLVFLIAPPRLKTVCWALVVGSLVIRVVAWLVASNENATKFCCYSTLAQLDGLSAGALLAILCREPGGLTRYVKYVIPLFVVGFLAFLATFLISHYARRGCFILTAGQLALDAMFCAVLAGAVALPRTHPIVSIFSSHPMRFFGKYSYAMYVAHLPVLFFVRSYWNTIDAPALRIPLLPQLGFLAVVTALTVGASLVSWHLIEKRFLVLKRFFK